MFNPPVYRVINVLLGAFLILFLLSGCQEKSETKIVKPEDKGSAFGMDLNVYHHIQDTIDEDQFLADILLPNGISYVKIDSIARFYKDSFDVRGLRAGKPYHLFYEDMGCPANSMVYDPHPTWHVKFDFNPLNVELVRNEIWTCVDEASGVISSSLWNTMIDNSLSYDLAAKMEDVFAWAIDFNHILPGDRFKLIYEREFVGDEFIGTGRILAAVFENADRPFYAYYFEGKNHKGYFDEEGRSMKKAFLKAPVKYTRISSRYNPRRFHPVLRRVKAHLGTDYAAPTGTPIYAVGNGKVLTASFTKNNGNYVKIAHKGNIQTQYLHMSRFARGIKSGVQVKQGDVIGYVGSTGLATGPHVCFRFWKNGRQVDHLRMNFPPPKPMSEEDIPAFMEQRDRLDEVISTIRFHEFKKDETQT